MKSFFLFLVLVAIVFIGCGGPELRKNEPASAVPVAAAPLQLEQVRVPVTVTGVIRSSREARLAFKNGGRIERMLVEAGRPVKKGDVLATLDQTEMDALYAQAAEAADKARRDAVRVENLYKDSTATLEQVQNARTGLEVALRQLELAAFNRKQVVLKAGSDGVILRRMANEGEWVAPGVPVLWIHESGDGTWILQAGLTDRDWARVTPGDSATLQMDAFPGRTFAAVVSDVSAMAEPTTGLFSARITLAGDNRMLASGLVATAQLLPRDAEPYLMLPASAVVEAVAGRVSYFIADPNSGTAQLRQAHAIRMVNDQIAVSGVSDPHEPVITTGARYVREGTRVAVLTGKELAFQGGSISPAGL